MHEAWLVARDFNDITSADEKEGGAAISICKCNIFKERVNSCNLLDLGTSGSKFTWRRPVYNGGQRIFEKLDRALGNEECRIEFPNGDVRMLTRLDFSDHHPLLITLMEAPHLVAQAQFRFKSVWFLNSTYNNMTEKIWKNEESMKRNLESVDKGIKNWKFLNFAQVIREKRVYEHALWSPKKYE
ncbi:unnamed protein product [Lathyrus sativus]|nr:unnamed protein product [Lathyrus sativus]